MELLRLRRECETQPQGFAGIDWNNPIARGLVLCVIPAGGGFYDVISDQFTTHPGTSRARTSIDGNQSVAVSAIGTNAASGGQFLNPTGMDLIDGVHSIFVEGSVEVNATNQAMIRSRDAVSAHGFGFHFDDATLASNGLFYWANNNNRTSSNSTALGLDSELYTHRAAFTNDGASSRFYTKGKLNRSTANTVLPTANTNRRTTILGNNLNVQTSGSSSLMLVWNRVLSLEEYQLLYQNPWQIFERPTLTFFSPIASSSGIISADGSSTGSTTVAATSQVTAGVEGSSTGTSTATAEARSIFFVAGSSVGSASSAGTAVTITQSNGESNGAASTSGTAITLATSNGASSGTATVSGSGYAIWRVDGNSAGIATVNGEGADGSGGTSDASGSSTGTSTAVGTAHTLTQAIAAALGTSNGSGTGAMVIASIGSAPSSSSTSAEAHSVANAAGSASGVSTAQGVVIIIAEAVGFAPSAAVVSALTQYIVGTIGQSSGTCTVSGVTEGGIHYTAVGDRFNVTITFSPYDISLNQPKFSITIK